LIGPIILPLREGHCIHAPAPGHEPDLAASAQAVDGEKHLVPRKTGALTRDLFEVAGMGSVQYVDHLSFYDRMLCHAPPLGNRMNCCRNSIALSVPQVVSRESRGRSSVAQGVTGLKLKGEGCTIRQVEEFRVSDKSGDCCQIPQ
jgi:hypothetical protein